MFTALCYRACSWPCQEFKKVLTELDSSFFNHSLTTAMPHLSNKDDSIHTRDSTPHRTPGNMRM